MGATPFQTWWRQSPLGRRLKRQEALFFSRALTLPYTARIVQIGVTGFEAAYLDQGYRPRFFPVEPSPTEGARLLAHPAALPFLSESVDLLLLPHALERFPGQRELLREAARVLRPEGLLLISGFYPLSPARLCHPRPAPWLKKSLAARRLLDWLELLNFSAELKTRFTAGPSPPFLAPLLVIGYGILAIKRRYAAIPLRLEPLPSSLPLTEGVPSAGRFPYEKEGRDLHRWRLPRQPRTGRVGGAHPRGWERAGPLWL